MRGCVLQARNLPRWLIGRVVIGIGVHSAFWDGRWGPRILHGYKFCCIVLSVHQRRGCEMHSGRIRNISGKRFVHWTLTDSLYSDALVRC